MISQGYNLIVITDKEQGSKFNNKFIIILSSIFDRNHIRQRVVIYYLYNLLSTSTMLLVSYEIIFLIKIPFHCFDQNIVIAVF